MVRLLRALMVAEQFISNRYLLSSILYPLSSILYPLSSILYSLFSILYSLSSILYSLSTLFPLGGQKVSERSIMPWRMAPTS